MEIPNRNSFNDITPTLTWIKNLPEISREHERCSIVERSCMERKKMLESFLQEGRSIENEAMFRTLVQLFHKHHILSISTTFSEVNKWEPFIIQKNTQFYPEQYPIAIFTLARWRYTRVWVIDNHGKYIENESIRHFPEYSFPAFSIDEIKSPQTLNIPENISPNLILPQEEKSSESSITTHFRHEIQKWDVLWKIITEKYDLSQSDNKNRDIANIALKLEKLPENRWAIKNGSIFAWKSLFLPSEISTVRLTPEREERKFFLKSEE